LVSGFGYGGGLYMASGSATLTNDSVDHNFAGTYTGIIFVNGYGGGIFIAPGATVYLDSFTVANTYSNSATWGRDIYGTYILLP
jgi:hypothetical protein